MAGERSFVRAALFLAFLTFGERAARGETSATHGRHPPALNQQHRPAPGVILPVLAARSAAIAVCPASVHLSVVWLEKPRLCPRLSLDRSQVAAEAGSLRRMCLE